MLSLLVAPRQEAKQNSARGSDEGHDGEQEALQVTLGGTESLIEHRRSVEGAHPVSPPNLLRLSVSV